MRRIFLVLFVVTTTQLLSSQIVFAAGGSSDSTSSEKSNAQNISYTEGKNFIEQENWSEAITSFSKVVQEDAKNADALNYLGYAHRRQGNLERAFDFYGQALAINPEHKGAHEYVGEAYLKSNNLPKAQEHLAKLDDICLFGCAEYTMLKRAIADYKKK